MSVLCGFVNLCQPGCSVIRAGRWLLRLPEGRFGNRWGCIRTVFVTESWAGLAITELGEDWKLAKVALGIAQGLCSSCVLTAKQGHYKMLAPGLASFLRGQDPNLSHSDLHLSRSLRRAKLWNGTTQFSIQWGNNDSERKLWLFMDLFLSPLTIPPSYNSTGKQITVIYQKQKGNTQPHKKPHC